MGQVHWQVHKHKYARPTRCTLPICFYRSLAWLVDVIRQVVLRAAAILVDHLRSLLSLGRGRRCFFIWHGLYRHAPQHTSPRHVVRTTLFSAFAVALSLALALAAHEADGLPVPVVHQVK